MVAALTQLRNDLQAAGSEPQAIAALLARMRDTGEFPRVLRAVIDDAETAERVAELSYRHPNGFDRIVLIDDGFDRPKARLHLWRPDEPSVVEQIHNHAWNFSSVVLTGALRFQIYDAVAEGDRKLRYQSLPPRHATSGYRLRYLGDSAVVCSFDSLLGQGTLYTLQHNAFHRVSRAGADVTATLVIHGPFVREHSEILADEPMNERHETRVQHFSVDQLRTTLSTVLDVMDR